MKTLATKTEFTKTPIITQYPNTDRQSQQRCTKHIQPKIAFQKASASTASVYCQRLLPEPLISTDISWKHTPTTSNTFSRLKRMPVFCSVTHQKTQRHVPGECNPQLHGCENLKTRNGGGSCYVCRLGFREIAGPG